MLRRSSVLIKILLLIAASALICAIAVDQFSELLSLTDNTSNDFTIREETFTARAPILSAVNYDLVPLHPMPREDGKRVRRPQTFEDGKPSSADLPLLCILRT